MLSRIVSHSRVLRRPQASRVVQRALSSSKGSSFELQAGEAGLVWRVPLKAFVGGAVLVGVGFAGVMLEVQIKAAAHGQQLNTLELASEVHGRKLDRLETGLNGLETRLNGVETRLSGLEKALTAAVERLEKSIAASLGELLRNADKDRRDLFHYIDRKAQVWGPTEAC